MRRVFPYPGMSIVLLLMWLLLEQSLAPLDILLGAVLGVVVVRIMVPLEAPPLRLRRPVLVLRLFFTVMLDILRSNVNVAKVVVAPGRRQGAPGFVRIPLELESRYGLTALATIISSTPGTLWVRFDTASRTLIIHVLDLADPDDWVRSIKTRYERPLREIFE